jgi:hypothetical protein
MEHAIKKIPGDRSSIPGRNQRIFPSVQHPQWSSRVGVGAMGQHPITRKKTHMLKKTMVWPCSENGRRKITQNSIEVDTETKESTRNTEEKLDGRYKEGHEQKKPK